MKKNDYWLRHFLICQKLGNEILGGGFEWQNFAALYLEEGNGVFGNQQMTCFFWHSDAVISDISASDEGIVFEELPDEYAVEKLALLDEAAIEKLYQEYVLGTTKI